MTNNESKIYNDKTKKNAELLEAIHNNRKMRKVNNKYLIEDYEIVIFENDVIRLAFQERGIKKVDYQLLNEIVYIEIFHNEIILQILKNGVFIGGKEYMLFSATTGQVRDNTITLMRKDLYENHNGYLMVGLSQDRINTHTNDLKKEKGMNVG